jgi:hypothetical protein
MEHHAGKLLNACCLPLSPLTGLKVDAEDAPKAAIGEKDGAGSAHPYKGTFLPKMGVVRSDLQLGRRLTKPFLIIESFGAALAGTEPTLFHASPKFLTPSFQLAGFMKFQVGWFENNIGIG